MLPRSPFLSPQGAAGAPSAPPSIGGGAVVDFGCNGTDDRWTLRCEAGQWEGPVGHNCTNQEAFRGAGSAQNDVGFLGADGFPYGGSWVFEKVTLRVVIFSSILLFFM